ncbi:MAG: HD domain-containing protein [Lachnospiraceae bacterium]|nr:HD domain-containing protein [Lachnospiraceae bacterium]
MYEYIREHQMNIMLALCAVCAMMAVLLLITRFLPKKRKWILIFMECVATCLLGFDRAAYLYKGDTSTLGYVMVRLSNFMVFFLTSGIVLGFNMYVTNLLMTDGKLERMPIRLKVSQIGAMMGMALAVIAHFTGLYYYFDGQNVYHRGPGFLIAYIIPVIIPLVQFSVILQYRKLFSRLIFASLILYIFLPIIVGVIQIFAYGISIVNMAMVMVSISLYIFSYLDVNDMVVRVHEQEKLSMRRLFEQTAEAFVTAVEKRDEYAVGHSAKVAEYAKKIALSAGKKEKECYEAYYAALLHDVGMIGVSDAVMKGAGDVSDETHEEIKQKPLLSEEILSGITEYPWLAKGARSVYERYDGKGYPDGISGDHIPELSRIIAVADAYEDMTSRKRNREPMPYNAVREELIEQAGLRFDPDYAGAMVHIMDEEHTREEIRESREIEKEIECSDYRSAVTVGIPVEEEIVRISFKCVRMSEKDAFSAPSIILFDSYDRHTHDNIKSIEAYRYMEYGEFWFDGHYVSTAARNVEVKVTKRGDAGAKDMYDGYEITAGRYEDHLTIKMEGTSHTVDIITAIPDKSKASYIGLTGENCRISDIEVKKTGETVKDGDIKRIVNEISYIDRMESDLPNIQIDHFHSASTAGIPLHDRLEMAFHTMSLPSAELAWHCPHIVIFYSEDGQINGKGYREYALIKLNGEVSGDEECAENRFHMKKDEGFPGWGKWKETNRKGMECSASVVKRGNRVTVHTENLGIAIENTTILKEDGQVYAALTGDLVALTDIRIKNRH